jgi:protein-arginine kinase activator protein McsA
LKKNFLKMIDPYTGYNKNCELCGQAFESNPKVKLHQRGSSCYILIFKMFVQNARHLQTINEKRGENTKKISSNINFIPSIHLKFFRTPNYYGR